MIIALALGIALGFISAVPVAGPISAIVFGLGMKGRYAQGRWVSLGAGFVECLYTFVAFWGFTHFLADMSFIFEVSNAFAAIALLAIGIYFYRSKKMRAPLATADTVESNAFKAFSMGAGISIVNPTLIATWTAAATSIYSTKLFEFTNFNSLVFSLGVCAGIFIWFTALLKIMEKNRSKLNPVMIDRGLKGIALILIGLSGWMTYRLLFL